MSRGYVKALITAIIILAITTLFIMFVEPEWSFNGSLVETFALVLAFSLFAVCCSSCSDQVPTISTLGIITCAVWCLINLAFAWNLVPYSSDNYDFYRFMQESSSKLLLAAIGFSHICLVLSVKAKEPGLQLFKAGTAVVAFIFYVIVFMSVSNYEAFYESFGSSDIPTAIGIVAIVCSILTPLFNKLSDDEYLPSDNHKLEAVAHASMTAQPISPNGPINQPEQVNNSGIQNGV